MLCPQCAGAAPNSEQAWAAARADFRKRAHIPDGFANYRLDTFDPKPDGGARSAAQRYAKSWPPSHPFLVIESPASGNGKTHLAIGIMNAVWEEHHIIGMFVSAVELLERFQATFGAGESAETTSDVLDDLRRTPLLVLDDLGAEKPTEWTKSRVYSVVNYRSANRLPLIVTTNRDLTEFDGPIADRLADEQVSHVLTIRGPGRRARA